jgi:hypothetical protein
VCEHGGYELDTVAFSVVLYGIEANSVRTEMIINGRCIAMDLIPTTRRWVGKDIPVLAPR